jgi:hypothetical protein
MIGNRLEQDIIKVFQDNITETYSINALSKILRKAYPYINKKTNFFIKEEVLRKINLGNSYQCFLNLRSEKTKIFMMMNELNKRDFYLQKNKLPISEFDDKSIVFLYEGKMCLLYASNLSVSNTLGNNDSRVSELKTISIQELAALLINGHGNKIVVMNNIAGYVNIISGLGDEILLKGLTRKE